MLEPVYKLMHEDSTIVCLIKPQFEAGREKVGKKGVVRDETVHLEVVTDIVRYVDGLGFYILGLEFSPVRGPEGNIEYLIYMKKDDETNDTGYWLDTASDIVSRANSAL